MGSYTRTFRRAAGWLAALVLCLVLTAACSNYASDYGITGSAPLGTVDAYEAALGSRVQTTTELDEERTEKLMSAYDGLEYADGLVGTRWENTGEWVIAIHDEGGKVLAIVSNFRSQAAGFSTIGKLIDAFTSKLWLTVAGGEPTFVATHYNVRSDEQFYLAKFGSGRRGGEWRKEPGGGDLAAVRSMVDTVWIWAR